MRAGRGWSVGSDGRNLRGAARGEQGGKRTGGPSGPPVAASLLETHKHDIGDILRESMQHERDALAHYYKLLEQVEGKNVQIEEYAREMIRTEEQHLGEVDKMLRKPGDIGKAG